VKIPLLKDPNRPQQPGFDVDAVVISGQKSGFELASTRSTLASRKQHENFTEMWGWPSFYVNIFKEMPFPKY
jgi:hypothetical protein